MADAAFSTVNVAPHPATYIPQPMLKKKAYVHSSQRPVEEPRLDMSDKNFPTLGGAPSAKAPTLNFLSKIKEAEANREEAFYDPEKIASMSVNQLIKEGWLIINRDGSLTGDKKPILPTTHTVTTPPYTKSPFPFHPDSSRRRVLSKKPSYTDLYDMDYEDLERATVPCVEDDDVSSV
jgi:hypothetical protein